MWKLAGFVAWSSRFSPCFSGLGVIELTWTLQCSSFFWVLYDFWVRTPIRITTKSTTLEGL